MPNPQNIIPPKKGEPSRNPNGRGKGVLNSKTRLLKLLELAQNAVNPITGQRMEFSTIELMDAAQIKKAIDGDTRAYEAILDRLEGRPHQTNDFTSGGEKLQPLIVVQNQKTADEIEKLR